VTSWLTQFQEDDRGAALELLDLVHYFSERDTEKALLRLNERLMSRLERSKIASNKLIYVQIHEAGSSSPVILNLLRDIARLERRGCRFVDGRDTRGLHDLTSQLEDGAIIYVDDFVASGTQFCASRDFASQYVVGNFSEFVLAPSICEEAYYKLGERGVEAVTGYVHTKQQRPLHADCSAHDGRMRERMGAICDELDPKGGRGYHRMATMVVFYRNAPNTVPLALRGTLGQKDWKGILPRSTDLPPLGNSPHNGN
jgi:hypothetical protein